jgi:transcriptional regulator
MQTMQNDLAGEVSHVRTTNAFPVGLIVVTTSTKKTDMYNFSYFKEKDKQTILDFIEENPFAFITGSFLSGKQVATQIPVLPEEKNGELYLQGHIMRNTDHHKALIENPEVLLMFTGPSCYISASWYSNPHIGSTWNYMSVHVNGQINFMSNEELIAFMRKLTLKFEKGNTQSLTFYDNLPEQFRSKMIPAIVGFEIKADKIENVFKLSQNRDEKSYLNIISKLEEQGGNSELIAKEMKKRYSDLFPPDKEWDGSKFDS